MIYPKVSSKPMERGGFAMWCRGCRTDGYAADAEARFAWKTRHDRECPELAPIEKPTARRRVVHERV